LAIIVAAIALILVVRDRSSVSEETATDASSVSTSVKATTVQPSTSTSSVVRSTVVTTPSTTGSDPLLQAGIDATAAVDRYLAAAGGRDESAFVAVWAYPIEDRYGEKGQDEVQLRAAAVAYWNRFPEMAFHRAGETTVTRSQRGWETSTPYSFDGIKANGERTCGATTLQLGFTDQWLVRTAAEDPPTRTC